MAEDALHATRACRKCGVEKPLTNEFFQETTWNRAGGFRHICSKCRSKQSMARRRGEAELRPLRALLTTEEKAARVAERNRRYYAANKDQMLEQNREWRRANPEWESSRTERRKASMSEYRKRKWAALTEDERAAHYARLAAWKSANPERAREIERRRLERIRSSEDLRAKATARAAAWRARNPEAAAALRDRRRARVVGAPGFYNKDDVRALLRQYGRKCFYCDAPLKKFQCDHFIPLARGGTNWPDNIRLSCPPCNLSKGAKLPWEWKPERFPPP